VDGEEVVTELRAGSTNRLAAASRTGNCWKRSRTRPSSSVEDRTPTGWSAKPVTSRSTRTALSPSLSTTSTSSAN